MTSPNLVPTPIVNKNGVHTTVYKAAGGAGSSLTSNLPAPALGGAVSATKPVAAQIMSDLSMTFEDTWVTVPSVITKGTVLRALEGYPEETKQYIREVQLRQPDDNYFDRMLISMLYHRDAPETIEDVLFAFDALTDSWDSFTYGTSWTDDRFDLDYMLTRTVNGAKSYGVEVCAYGTEDKSLRHYDEQTRKKAMGLIDLYSEMSNHTELRGGLGGDDTAYYLTDKSTVEHVVKNSEITHDMIAKMVDEMLIHGRTDWDVVQAMTNAPSAPLSEGTL